MCSACRGFRLAAMAGVIIKIHIYISDIAVSSFLPDVRIEGNNVTIINCKKWQYHLDFCIELAHRHLSDTSFLVALSVLTFVANNDALWLTTVALTMHRSCVLIFFFFLFFHTSSWRLQIEPAQLCFTSHWAYWKKKKMYIVRWNNSSVIRVTNLSDTEVEKRTN